MMMATGARPPGPAGVELAIWEGPFVGKARSIGAAFAPATDPDYDSYG